MKSENLAARLREPRFIIDGKSYEVFSINFTDGELSYVAYFPTPERDDVVTVFQKIDGVEPGKNFRHVDSLAECLVFEGDKHGTH